ncbi:MAG: GntR family transcriptional regulator, partial [Pseudomonadota bacterium]
MSAAGRMGWRTVRAQVHAAILDGTFAPGQKLPRDSDLAARLNCARSTVQRAMQDLARGGIVERRRKGGTRVRPDPVPRASFDIPIVRAEVEATGAAYGYRLLSRVLGPPPPSIAHRLSHTGDGAALRVEALHLEDDRPYLLEDRWISLATVPEIRDIDLTAISANEWLVQNRPYSRCKMEFSATVATDAQAARLGCAVGAPLFAMDRTTWRDASAITTVTALAAPGYRL